MKKQILVCALAILAVGQVASAVTIGANQLLGIVEPGTPASAANDLNMINGLLQGWGTSPHVAGYNDGAASGTVMGDNPIDSQGEIYTLKYTATTMIPVAPTAPIASASTLDGTLASFDLGGVSYDWLVAKWGSDSAVYYIGGITGEITLSRGGTGWAAEAHGLSGWRLFPGSTKNVPDGGSTALLMGLGLIGLGWIKQRLS